MKESEKTVMLRAHLYQQEDLMGASYCHIIMSRDAKLDFEVATYEGIIGSPPHTEDASWKLTSQEAESIFWKKKASLLRPKSGNSYDHMSLCSPIKILREIQLSGLGDLNFDLFIRNDYKSASSVISLLEYISQSTGIQDDQGKVVRSLYSSLSMKKTLANISSKKIEKATLGKSESSLELVEKLLISLRCNKYGLFIGRLKENKQVYTGISANWNNDI